LFQSRERERERHLFSSVLPLQGLKFAFAKERLSEPRKSERERERELSKSLEARKQSQILKLKEDNSIADRNCKGKTYSPKLHVIKYHFSRFCVPTRSL